MRLKRMHAGRELGTANNMPAEHAEHCERLVTVAVGRLAELAAAARSRTAFL